MHKELRNSKEKFEMKEMAHIDGSQGYPFLPHRKEAEIKSITKRNQEITKKTLEA